MDITRTITHLEVDWWKEPNGYHVQVTTKYCESTWSSGQMKTNVDRYEKMTLDEAREVMEAVASGPAPGDEYVVQYSLWTLT